MKALDYIAFALLIAFAIYSIFLTDNDPVNQPPTLRGSDSIEVRRPKPVSPTEGVPLPDADIARDPEVLIAADEERTDSTGSAVSIDADGYWLTARHVVDACDRTYILLDRKEMLAIEVENAVFHPNADVAMLRTRRGWPALKLDNQLLHVGQDGYAFGFPKGEPGEVRGQLIGRATLRITGRRQAGSPLLVWSEQARFPNRAGSLGGLSGGPMLDDEGEVIGVTVAESRRRGRVMTADLVSARQLFGATSDSPDFKTKLYKLTDSIDEDDFSDHANALRESLTVAQVVCLVE